MGAAPLLRWPDAGGRVYQKKAPPDGGASCLICLSLAFQKRRQIGERCTAVRLPVIRSSSRTKMDASRAAPRIIIMQLFIAAQAKAAQVSCADAAVFMVMAVVIAAHFLSLNVEGSIAYMHASCKRKIYYRKKNHSNIQKFPVRALYGLVESPVRKKETGAARPSLFSCVSDCLTGCGTPSAASPDRCPGSC